jgi:hypothetical protein
MDQREHNFLAAVKHGICLARLELSMKEPEKADELLEALQDDLTNELKQPVQETFIK